MKIKCFNFLDVTKIFINLFKRLTACYSFSNILHKIKVGKDQVSYFKMNLIHA